MPRGKSISYSSAASPFSSSTTDPLPSSASKISSSSLKKTASMADLKSSSKGMGRKWLRRLKSKGDFDFGCAGELGFAEEEREDEEAEGEEDWGIREISERLQHQTMHNFPTTPRTAPPAAYGHFSFPTSSPPISPPPSRPVTMPSMPALPSRLVPTDPEEYDQYVKEKTRLAELRLAEEACLAYCTGSVPALLSSRTSSSDNSHGYRSRSNSSSSSADSPCSLSSSSRPRTNDSLPSSFECHPHSPKHSSTTSPGRTIFPAPMSPDASRLYNFI